MARSSGPVDVRGSGQPWQPWGGGEERVAQRRPQDGCDGPGEALRSWQA
jgi:hypothetical protein